MEVATRFKSLLTGVKNVVITTHLIPDADGVGSQIALGMALSELGYHVTCVNQAPLLDRYKYLDPNGIIISCAKYVKTAPKEEIDLFIVVDTNNLDRIGDKVCKIVKKSKNLIFIDHHPCPSELLPIHCIDTSSAATAEVVGGIIELLGVQFSTQIALALYTAILVDTSSFRYPTVSGRTHKLLGKLMDAGITSSHAYNLIYGTKQLSHMQLLGTVLSSVKTTKDGCVAWLSITHDLMKEFNVEYEDTHSFINHLLILNNIRVACMFREVGQHVKISLRSTGNVDVGAIAQALGGGGHDHSAATIVEGQLDVVAAETIRKLEIIVGSCPD
ncbi:MAG: bifunctional oligoribonuclease/PAP phosphatase NrnA [Bacteriovoracaceae bacterium]|nr:bifunctional oligoribonuclease/PAP phosphatase NrnA [Bacteriovoracaceae bacterium]